MDAGRERDSADKHQIRSPVAVQVARRDHEVLDAARPCKQPGGTAILDHRVRRQQIVVAIPVEVADGAQAADRRRQRDGVEATAAVVAEVVRPTCEVVERTVAVEIDERGAGRARLADRQRLPLRCLEVLPVCASRNAREHGRERNDETEGDVLHAGMLLR